MSVGRGLSPAPSASTSYCRPLGSVTIPFFSPLARRNSAPLAALAFAVSAMRRPNSFSCSRILASKPSITRAISCSSSNGLAPRIASATPRANVAGSMPGSRALKSAAIRPPIRNPSA